MMRPAPQVFATAYVLTALVAALVAGAASAAWTIAGLSPDSAISHGLIEEGHPTPRADTASVIERRDGTLLAVYQRATDGVGDHARMSVWTRVSSDKGLTWDEPKMIIDAGEDDINVGMPAMARLPSGNILLACLVHHDFSSTTMRLFRSRDEGASFVEEAPIWQRSAGIQLQGGANSMVVLKNGRIVLPIMFGSPGMDTRKLEAGCYVSEDEGRSWRSPQHRIVLPRRGALEPSVAELSDGRLVMSIRTQLGGPYLSHSQDCGETWSYPEPAGWDPVIRGPVLEGGESCTVLRRIPGTEALLLIWNNADYVSDVPGYRGHFGRRTPLTAAVTCDAGKTWAVIGDIAHDPTYHFTNPNCIFLSDGRALVTYYAYNRTVPWPEPPRPDHTALRVALIEQRWFDSALKKARELAESPPSPYVPPG